MNDEPSRDPRRYIRIAAMLRIRITDGTLHPDDPVPSIASLARELNCARQTVARGYEILTEEGLIYRIPGLGYYVR
jgi:GntR family transcriptional regulator